jgi:outer membrane protein assembly factor BamB
MGMKLQSTVMGSHGLNQPDCPEKNQLPADGPATIPECSYVPLKNTRSGQLAITHRFLLILLILASAVLVVSAAGAVSIIPEPSPGWKYHGELNNTGLYNDGGFRPNGRELWNVSDTTGSDIQMVESSPAVVNGVVYVTDRGDPGHLFAINAYTGAIKWENTLADTSWTSPAVANGMVYVGTGWPGSDTPGTFYAFNASTGGSGTPVWKKTLPNGNIGSSPSVAYGNVYVGRADHNVSAWNAKTGAEVWTFKTNYEVYSSPAVYNGTVYFSVPEDSGGDNIIAVNATTGKKVWDAKHAPNYDGSYIDAGAVLGSSPAVANGVLYIGGYSGVYAFDANTGAQLRKFHDNVGSSYLSTPAVANGLVYFGTHGASPHKFYALFANNFSVKWKNLTPDDTEMDASPAVANGVVYVTSDRQNNYAKGFLYAWNATTGAPLWKFLPVGAGGTSSGPAVANGVVYFGTWWNGLYAVGTEHILTVTNPNGGNNWKQGSTQTIKWSYMGSPGSMGNPGSKVKIELIKGTAVSRVINPSTSIGSGGSGSYTWIVPYNQVVGTNYKIRITSTSNAAYTDKSDANFTISAGAPITVLVPNGGANWKRGTSHTITWKYNGNPGSKVKIDLLKGTAVNSVINASTTIGSGGSGSYSWKIPSNQVVGTDYKVRITSTSNAAYTDKSDANFGIGA